MKKYFYKYKGWLFFWQLSLLLLAGMDILIAFFMQSVTDNALSGEWSKLMQSILFGGLYVLFLFLINYMSYYAQRNYLKNTVFALRNDIFSAVLEKDLNSFNENKTSHYLSVLSNDVGTIANDYFYKIPHILSDIVLALTALITLLFFHPILAVVDVIVSAFVMLIPLKMGKSIENFQKDYSVATDHYTADIKDMFQGFEVIQCFDAKDHAKNKFYRSAKTMADKLYRVNKKQGFVYSMSESLTWITFTVNTLLAAYFVSKGEMTVGTMIGSAQVLNYVTFPISRISNNYMSYKAARGNCTRVEKILYEKEISHKTYLPLKSITPLCLEDVCFSYEKEKPVLKHISYQFKYGKKYAVVGNSGSGKSTLLKLLMQYYDEYSGKILVDGDPLNEIDKKTLYQSIAMIHQNVIIFDDTMRNNITMFEEFPEDEIHQVVQKAGLVPLLDKLSNGLDTQASENGQNFSGGERQRLSIARALLRHTPMLLLDEATSSLDAETAVQIESLLLRQEDVTIIVVTHKLNSSLLKQYDEIIALKNGEIVEQGTFDKLMEQKGYFYSLYSIQV